MTKKRKAAWWFACAIVYCLSLAASTAVAQSKAVPHAHAHNDYLHDRPLLDALEQGFNSVEADIFLVKGKLLVAHDIFQQRPERTLETLYLDPLKQRIAAEGGQVFRNAEPFVLMIDIKSEGESTYKELHQVLEKYASILTKVENDQVHRGPVKVIISGNRPIETISKQTLRYCGIDGRVSDLDSSVPAHLMPMISDNWTKEFRWRGKGEAPAEEQAKLKRIVEQAHAKGRIVRFWATPEEPALWKLLLDAKVDLINTDQLRTLSDFLQKQ